MLRAILNRKIDKTERELGVPLDEARYLVKVSLAVAWRIAKFTKLLHATQGKSQILHVASLVGSMADDCGSCVQIGVNFARKAGVPRQHLMAIVEHRPEDLPEPLALVYRFAESVTRNREDQDELREQVRQQFGDRGLVDICLAVAMHRVFPTLKRGLGYAKSCSQVMVSV